MRRLLVAVVALGLAGPAWADGRPPWYPQGYIQFSCVHLPDGSVTSEKVAMYENNGKKLVVAPDFETFQALVMTDRVANLSPDGQFYENNFPSMVVDGKKSEPFTWKYYLRKSADTGKPYLKVFSSSDGQKVMDCTVVEK